MNHTNDLFNVLFLLLPCKYWGLSVGTPWLVHTVPQHSHAYLYVWTIRKVSHPMSQFEFIIHVFGHCWYLCRWQNLLPVKVYCCNGQLITHLHELVENRLCHYKILIQSKIFVVLFLENFEFYIQVVGVVFVGPKKTPKSVSTTSKVYIVGRK